MNVPPEVREFVSQWVRKAEHDLEAARRIMTVEKYLKALLTSLAIQASRTHSLLNLASLLPPEATLPVEVAELASMNPYAVDVRYADDWREPQRCDALKAMSLALRVPKEITDHLARLTAPAPPPQT